jgi:uncharacterized membrane protein YgdD (TMEM256/DUF423 family)
MAELQRAHINLFIKKIPKRYLKRMGFGAAMIRPMERTFILMAALAGLVGVALGAFGAHGLRGRLTPEMLAVFETGVRYQLVHAVALLAMAGLMDRLNGWLITSAGWLFFAGIVLFSGSLYLLALTGVTILGAITPLGGLAFLAGWACLAIAAI